MQAVELDQCHLLHDTKMSADHFDHYSVSIISFDAVCNV